MSAGKPDEHLEKVITVRVSKRFFDGLEERRKKTNCQTVSEMVRAILYKERIMFYYTDASLNATAIELTGIRKELNHIAGNVSDITQAFHSADSEIGNLGHPKLGPVPQRIISSRSIFLDTGHSSNPRSLEWNAC